MTLFAVVLILVSMKIFQTKQASEPQPWTNWDRDSISTPQYGEPLATMTEAQLMNEVYGQAVEEASILAVSSALEDDASASRQLVSVA